MNSPHTRADVLSGVWRSSDEYGSSVEYRVRKKTGRYTVVVRDTSDGELADVFEEKWKPKEKELSFAAYWNSTGRFTRCRLHAVSKSQIQLTYTHTDSEFLIRKNKSVPNKAAEPTRTTGTPPASAGVRASVARGSL